MNKESYTPTEISNIEKLARKEVTVASYPGMSSKIVRSRHGYLVIASEEIPIYDFDCSNRALLEFKLLPLRLAGVPYSIWETYKGFRIIADLRVRPNTYLGMLLLSMLTLDKDSGYFQGCIILNNYRARLTGKPWKEGRGLKLLYNYREDKFSDNMVAMVNTHENFKGIRLTSLPSSPF